MISEFHVLVETHHGRSFNIVDEFRRQKQNSILEIQN